MIIMTTNFVEALMRVANLFDAVGARYALVGSVASSRHGLPHATNDVDLVTDLSLQQDIGVTGIYHLLKEFQGT